MLQHNGKEISGGRVVRTVIAFLLLAISGVMLVANYVIVPLRGSEPVSVGLVDAGFHIIVILAAILIYDHKAGKAIVSALGDIKLPIIGKK